MMHTNLDHLDHLIQKLTMRYGVQDPDVLHLRIEFDERVAAAIAARKKFKTRPAYDFRTSTRRKFDGMARSRFSSLCAL
jgi:hypothetical protein